MAIFNLMIKLVNFCNQLSEIEIIPNSIKQNTSSISTINQQNPQNTPILITNIYIASLYGDLEKLKYFVEDGANRSITDVNGYYALQWASLNDFPHIVQFIIENVSVVLENYTAPHQNIGSNTDKQQSESGQWVQEVHNDEGHIISSPKLINRIPSWRVIVNTKGELSLTDPGFWSTVCLNNMAMLGKEATTARRVLESLFRYFDHGNLWSSKHGIACPVLRDMQTVMESFGHSTHFLLSILVKHLDHINVLKQLEMQLDIVEVTISLAKQAEVEPSVSLLATFMRRD